MKRVLALMTVLLLLSAPAQALQFRWRNCLTGAGTSCLDGVTGMADGDITIVATKSGTTLNLYFYVYDDDDSTSESSPNVIEPNTGSGAWSLGYVQGLGFTGNIAEGYRKWNATNTDGYDGTPSTGDCYFESSTNKIKCYDGDSWREVALSEPE